MHVRGAHLQRHGPHDSVQPHRSAALELRPRPLGCGAAGSAVAGASSSRTHVPDEDAAAPLHRGGAERYLDSKASAGGGTAQTPTGAAPTRGAAVHVPRNVSTPCAAPSTPAPPVRAHASGPSARTSTGACLLAGWLAESAVAATKGARGGNGWSAERKRLEGAAQRCLAGTPSSWSARR